MDQPAATSALNDSRARSWRVAALAAAWTMAVAGLGGLATDLGPWYYALKQPPWKPPDPWFGPAWTLIFTLTAWGCARAWLAGQRTGAVRAQRALLAAVVVNSVLNVAWSWLFFGLRRPDWALVEWLPFWLSIAVLAACAWRLDRRAALLLLPYLAWVTFAGALNAAVVELNRPFGSAARVAVADGAAFIEENERWT